MSNKRPTLREGSHQQSNTPVSGGYELSTGVRNFLLFVLGWSCLSHFLMVTGLWTYEGANSSFDVVMSTMNIIFPIIGVVFILILYDRQQNS